MPTTSASRPTPSSAPTTCCGGSSQGLPRPEGANAVTHLSPGIRAVEPYPFEDLDRRVKAARDAGRDLVDLGVGDPRDETPAFIRRALADAIEPTSSYPRAAGVPELRAAIAAWVGRRFGATLDPEIHVLPTLGSKEILFALASYVADPAAGRDTVIVT